MTRTPRQVAYDHAFAEAAAAHESVMAPARAGYERAIVLAKACGPRATLAPGDLQAWRDAYSRAKAAFDAVMASHSYEETAAAQAGED